MKIKKILSFGTLAALVLNITAPVYSSEIKTEIPIIKNEMEITASYASANEEKITADELFGLVRERGRFSSLTENEKAQIAENYMVNQEKMELCESDGYNIENSIEISKILQNTALTIDVLKEMENVFGGWNNALNAAKKFANYRYTHSSSNITYNEKCIEYLVSGISPENILKAMAMASVIGCEIQDSAKFDRNEDDYNVEDNIDYLAYLFCTNPTCIKEYMSKNQLTEEEFFAQIEGLSSILTEVGDEVTTFTMGGADSLYDPENYPLAPFTYDRNGTEVINEQTGAVGYCETDAVIKGKNGLDLKIGTRYNTANAEKSVITADNVGIGTVRRKDTTVPKSMYSPMANFAPGWEFDSSRIKYYVLGFNDVYPGLVDKDGNTRSIKRSDLEDSDITELRLYDGRISLYDVRLYKDSSYTDNDVTSMFCAKYDDGRCEYFDSQGKLMKVQNRYGDSITYRYYKTGSEIEGFRQYYNKVEITDTLGQVTTIEKMVQAPGTDIYGRERNIQMMIVTLPDGKNISYKLRASKHPNNKEPDADFIPVLEGKTNQEGMTTTFEYIEDDVSLFSFVYVFSDDFSSRSIYPITAINHPSGLRTEYTYEHFFGQLSSGTRTCERYRITGRKDIFNETEYNKEDYSYVGDYTRTLNSETVTSVSVTNEDGLTTEWEFTRQGTSIYSSYRIKTGERVYYKDGENEINVSKTVYGSDYYERTYPETVNKYIYGQTSDNVISTVEKYEYNDHGKCIKYWNPRAGGDINNTENLTTYTYDSEYGQLTGCTYKKDSNTTVNENYELSQDHKNVLSKSVLMNNALVEKTEYTYGENTSCPSSQRVLRSTADGDSVTTYYTYADNTFKTGESVNGKSTAYAYDIYGNVLSVTDANGNMTQYSYDGLNRKTEVINADNTTEKTEYLLSATGQSPNVQVINRVTATDRGGAKTEYNFDAIGRLMNKKNMTLNILAEQHEYDSMGKRTKVTFPSGAYILYTYDVTGRNTEQKVCNASGDTEYTESYVYTDVYDANTSKVTTICGNGDEAVKTAKYTDIYGNTVREDLGDTEQMSQSRIYQYDYKNNLTAELYRQNENSADEIRTQISVVPNPDNGVIVTTKDCYNRETKVYKNMSGQESKTIDGNGNVTYYAYNADGRLSAVSTALGTGAAVTRYTYDNNGNKIQESVSDNKPGEAESVKNTYTEYDNMNRITSVFGDEEGKTKYTYDLRGNVKTLSSGITETNTTGNVTTYEYDALGRRIKATDPLGQSEIYAYDNMNNLITVTDRNGTVTDNTYNALKNLTNVIRHNGSKTAATGYEYNNSGLLKKVFDDETSVEYEYNIKGQTVKIKDALAEQNVTVKEYSYDNDGNTERFKITTDSLIYDTGYSYDKTGKLLSVKDNMSNKTVASYQYDNSGNISKKILDNGITTQYTYNSLGALESLSNKKGSAVLSSYDYAYNLDGSVYRVTDNGGRVQNFVYDKNGRLISETDTADNSAINYTYDAFGNRTSMTDNGAVTTYVYDKNNRLVKQTSNVGETDYTYDKNGNMLTKSIGTSVPADSASSERARLGLGVMGVGTSQNTENAAIVSYDYDLLNRLISVQSNDGLDAAYQYDVNGMRISKTINGNVTNYKWNGSDMVSESGKSYFYGHGIIGSKLNAAAEYYIKDGHGSITGTADSSGNIKSSYAYDAFGNENSNNNDDSNPFGYNSEYLDRETGLIYLRARYYDPSIGRFISEDPIKDGSNWYAFCNNNPVTFIDPSGMKFVFDDDYSENLFNKYSNIINKRSETGSYLLNIIEKNDRSVKVVFKDKSGNSSYDDRGNINQIKIYLKRSGESEILNDGEIMATLVHEMTHTYTDFQGYNNVFSLRYIATKEMYDKTVIPVTPVRQYEEAAAITVEEKFRNEMKLEPRNEKYGIISTKNGSYGFFIHDVMMLPAGEDNPYKGRIDIINDDLDSVKRPTLMMTKLIALDIKRTALKMGFFYNK